MGPSWHSDSQDTERLYPHTMCTLLHGRMTNLESSRYSIFSSSGGPAATKDTSPTWAGMTTKDESQSSTEHLGFPTIFYTTFLLWAHGVRANPQLPHPDDISQIRQSRTQQSSFVLLLQFPQNNTVGRRCSLRSPRPDVNSELSGTTRRGQNVQRALLYHVNSTSVRSELKVTEQPNSDT